jgi:hypothetical protein
LQNEQGVRKGLNMKRAYYYAPLTIAILFGLAISAIASSPVVYGDNVPGCQGTGSSTAKVILGGRVITPSTILRTANGQPCEANETSINIVSMIRTVVVSPNGTPSQNGTALLSAMTTISNASPSAANPWLLKLEPGNYDLGSSALVLKPYVDLEGSGEGTTTISSTIVSTSFPPAQGTLVMASNTEARFVRLLNSGNKDTSYISYNTAILVGSGMSNVRVIHVTTNVLGGNRSYGFFNDGGTVTIKDSSLYGWGGSDGYGLINNTASATLTLQNSALSANGGYAYGLHNKGGTANVLNSTLNADGVTKAQSQAYGLYNADGGTSNIQNSGLFSSAVASSVGLFIDSGSVTVKNSIMSGSASNGYGVDNNNGTVGIGASQLSGSSGLANGTVTCVASYNASYAALSATCN